ncbi:MAG: hypothetical protein QNJ26_21825, partial [Desulfobacterales bacterium]|nr:hypothetical protein [Desulfobacterales bacterium]
LVLQSAFRYGEINKNNRIVLIPDRPFLGGPEADADTGDAFPLFSDVESNPYISYRLQVFLSQPVNKALSLFTY